MVQSIDGEGRVRLSLCAPPPSLKSPKLPPPLPPPPPAAGCRSGSSTATNCDKTSPLGALAAAGGRRWCAGAEAPATASPAAGEGSRSAPRDHAGPRKPLQTVGPGPRHLEPAATRAAPKRPARTPKAAAESEVGLDRRGLCCKRRPRSSTKPNQTCRRSAAAAAPPPPNHLPQNRLQNRRSPAKAPRSPKTHKNPATRSDQKTRNKTLARATGG